MPGRGFTSLCGQADWHGRRMGVGVGERWRVPSKPEREAEGERHPEHEDHGVGPSDSVGGCGPVAPHAGWLLRVVQQVEGLGAGPVPATRGTPLRRSPRCRSCVLPSHSRESGIGQIAFDPNTAGRGNASSDRSV